MGRLSNPPEHLKHLVERCVETARVRLKRRSHRSHRSGHALSAANGVTSEERGRLSNPTPRPVQRRLRQAELDQLAADYQSGQSLRVIGEALGVHHHTVAAKLEQLGIPRRQTQPKMTADDVVEASRRYQAGDSLNTLAIVFNVDAATINRKLRRAGTIIRPRRGWPHSVL